MTKEHFLNSTKFTSKEIATLIHIIMKREERIKVLSVEEILADSKIYPDMLYDCTAYAKEWFLDKELTDEEKRLFV